MVGRLKVQIAHEYFRFLIYWHYRLYHGGRCVVLQSEIGRTSLLSCALLRKSEAANLKLRDIEIPNDHVTGKPILKDGIPKHVYIHIVTPKLIKTRMVHVIFLIYIIRYILHVS